MVQARSLRGRCKREKVKNVEPVIETRKGETQKPRQLLHSKGGVAKQSENKFQMIKTRKGQTQKAHTGAPQ